jgi:rhamnose utilization protein RhaD (predicted bifunctional aldolase and dehydrogenase)
VNSPDADNILTDLIGLANRLGDPAHDYIILGEGNTSARIDDDTFWVTASGVHLETAKANGFVRVRFDRILQLLDQDLSDDETRIALSAAKEDAAPEPRPSVETLLHAVLLGLKGVSFVGHTHPTAINSITCSQAFEQVAAGRIFPDEVVLCGPATLLVPYVDPGLPLARAVQSGVHGFINQHGQVPRIILMQNHGLIALGSSAKHVEHATAMAVKAARIMLGTFALGGPRFLPQEHINRIHNRPDEHYRQQIIEDGS